MLGCYFLLLSIAQADARPQRLAVIQTAPDFELTTHDDKPLRSTALRSKVCLVSFIFTTCNGTCPATTHRMCQVQQELKNRGRLKNGRVQLLSISLDPNRDTTDVLRSYMRLYDVDAGSWSFLTGTPEQVDKVVKDWGMWARPGANSQLDHPSRIYLVDGEGKIREIYNLGFMKTAWVAEDIEALLNEKSRSQQ